MKKAKVDWIGDFALTLNDFSGVMPGRSATVAWELCCQEATWHLWQQPVSPEWRGYPVTAVAVNEWSVWLIGEFYGRDTMEGLTSFFDGRLSPTALNGHFQLWAWNRSEKQWHIWTDRFGTLHSYLAHNGQHMVVSTFFAAATAVSRRQLDWRALTGFFAFGFFPQDLTYFDDIKILKPATHYVINLQGEVCHADRYWQWWYEPDERRTYDEAIIQFAEIFNGVLDEMVTAPSIALPISGGLDSRSTVAAITRNGREPQDLWSYSYGFGDDSVETQIARKVAGTRNLPFSQFAIPPYLFNRLATIVASVEGFQDVTQARQAAVTTELKRRADFVIAAHWGDVWLDDMGLIGVGEDEIDQHSLLEHVLHKLEKGGRSWLLENLCKPVLGEYKEVIHELVKPELGKTRFLKEPDFRVKAFKTDFWSWRWTTASLRMFQPGAFPRVPFYDTRLADFFCTLPSCWVRQRQFQIDYLKRFAPDLAAVRWQPYDTNLFRTQYFHTWLVPKRAMNKGWRMIRRNRVIERNWEVQFLSENGRLSLNNWLLEPGLKIHEFVAPESLGSLIDDFYTDPWRGKRGYTLSILLTFSAWLEQYG